MKWDRGLLRHALEVEPNLQAAVNICSSIHEEVCSSESETDSDQILVSSFFVCVHRAGGKYPLCNKLYLKKTVGTR